MSDSKLSFVARPNIVTGQQDWEFVSEEYDFEQEIARSSYADMLHDNDRNRKYYEALSKVIGDLRKQNRHVHVLDIGTGTGLLSMMAVQCGADEVTACEAFAPVAKCAAEVIAENGMSDRIRLISKRSTEVAIGQDMSTRANVLVAEVFDTELIGESALHTFRHAAKELLTPDAVVIPSAARLYVQVAESEFLWSHHKLAPSDIEVPKSWKECPGCPSVYDLQISELTPGKDFTLLTEAVLAKRFSFFPLDDVELRDTKIVRTSSVRGGKAQVFFMWWDLLMEPSGEIVLTCAPSWALENGGYNWRDHWMQAVYFPVESVPLNTGDEAVITMHHDDYSLWFDVANGAESYEIGPGGSPTLGRPLCSCGLHIAWNRQRIAQLNSVEYRDRCTNVMDHLLKKNCENVTVLSDSSLLPMLLSKRGVSCLYLDRNVLSRRAMESLIDANCEKTKPLVFTELKEITAHLTKLDTKLDAVVAEPYFVASFLPWHNMHFWYALNDLRPYMAPLGTISPSKMIIKGILVEFTHLWKIRAPVGVCEGFDIRKFDDMVKQHSDQTDSNVEPQPLWEYPGRALSTVTEILEMELTRPITNDKEISFDVSMDVASGGRVNAVALWCDWKIMDDVWYTTGLEAPCAPGDELTWNRFCQQGVILIDTPLLARGDGKVVVRIRGGYNTDIGETSFNVNFEKL